MKGTHDQRSLRRAVIEMLARVQCVLLTYRILPAVINRFPFKNESSNSPKLEIQPGDQRVCSVSFTR